MADEENLKVEGSVSPSGPLTIVTRGIAVSPDTISTVLHEKPRSDIGAALGWGGVTITIWLTFATATFHDFFSIPAGLLQSAFLLAGLLATGATAYSAWSYLRRSETNSVKAIVEEICRRSGN